MTVTLSGVEVNDILYLRTSPITEKPLIADIDYGGLNGNFFKVGENDNETAQNLAHCINDLVQWDDGMFTEYYYSAEYLGGSQVRISRYDIDTHEQLSVEAGHYRDTSGHYSPALDPLPVLPPDEVTIGGVTFTATTGATAGTSFNVGGTDTENLQQLADAINAYGGWAGGVDYGATVTDGRLILSKTEGGVAAAVDAGDFSTNITGGGSGSMSLVASSNELAVLEAQYNTMRSQLTTLALDSYYKGKNLLNAQNMTVRFENTSLMVAGFDASAAGLGITEATWTTGGDMNADITLLESALARLRRGSADMSNNLSIITARQTFSEMMENILTEGSDRLTLADTSEEGANMLMLQTRQSLGMNVLSLSADAAQSVLQLFR
jgi:flagellin-like hook-associated protein FlgL